MQSTDYELYGNYSSRQGGQFSRLSFQGNDVYTELFNVVIKPRDLWTIYHNPCFKQGMLVQNVSKGRVKAVGRESASMLSQCSLSQSIEEEISAETSTISIFLSLRKVSSLHDKAGRGKPIGH